MALKARAKSQNADLVVMCKLATHIQSDGAGNEVLD